MWVGDAPMVNWQVVEVTGQWLMVVDGGKESLKP